MQMLYQHLLNGLRSQSETSGDDAAFSRYLQSIKPAVRQLWESLNGSSKVEVDYSTPEIQLAYLIRYYPYYVQSTHAILKELDVNLFSFQAKELRICLFGAGSAPEIIALTKFLSDSFPAIESLKIHIFDIADQTWKISRNIAQNYLLPQYWSKKISIASHTLDFCNVDSFLQIQEIIKHSQLFIFQNCLNELGEIETAIDNIQLLLQAMPESSHLLVIDLSQYRRTSYVLNAIKMRTLEFSNFLIAVNENLEISVRRDLPSELTTYVLDGTHGCKPRKSVKCSFIHVCKKAVEPNLTHDFGNWIQTLDDRTLSLNDQLEQMQIHWHNERLELQSHLDLAQLHFSKSIQDFESQAIAATESNLLHYSNQVEQKINSLEIQLHHLSRKVRLNRRILGALLLSNLLTLALAIYGILQS